MSCYFIAHIKINDLKEYEKYLNGYDEIFSKYRGNVIAVDDNPEVLEGKNAYARIVIIRFPDEAELKKWYFSQEYQELVKFRWNSSDSDIIMVHGRD